MPTTVTTSLQQAADHVGQHHVICYPTEGVWGIGCHPQSQAAFERVLALKQRSETKGVILLAANYAQIQPYAQISPTLKTQLNDYWAGFVTCLLPKSPDCPEYLSGEHDSIAVRMTAYEPLRQLCLSANTAVVSTSANRAGQPPVSDLSQAMSLFGEQVDCYWDAPLGGQNKPSTIIDLTGEKWRVIRD